MDILYISHCVPWPPDKGDRICAYHSVRTLVDHHRVHLAALARSEAEAAAGSDLRDRLASVRIEVLDLNRAVIRGIAGLAGGGCFTTAFHHSPTLQAHVLSILQRFPIGAVVILSSSMASYATDAVPFLADWGTSISRSGCNTHRCAFPVSFSGWKGYGCARSSVPLRSRRGVLFSQPRTNSTCFSGSPRMRHSPARVTDRCRFFTPKAISQSRTI